MEDFFFSRYKKRFSWWRNQQVQISWHGVCHKKFGKIAENVEEWLWMRHVNWNCSTWQTWALQMVPWNKTEKQVGRMRKENNKVMRECTTVCYHHKTRCARYGLNSDITVVTKIHTTITPNNSVQKNKQPYRVLLKTCDGCVKYVQSNL